MTPPIRFLAAAFGSWACLRGVMLIPSPAALPAPEPAEVVAAAPSPSLPFAKARRPVLANETAATVVEFSRSAPALEAAVRPEIPQPPSLPIESRGFSFIPKPVPQWSLASLPMGDASSSGETSRRDFPGTAKVQPSASRWTGSAWVHGRAGDAPGLTPGGLLGGSQAGARIRYRVSPALQLGARVSSPLGRIGGAEAAAGVEWQPLDRVPMFILAERRQTLARGGRNAFAVTLHGGVSEVPMPAGFRLDAYAQTGAVGTRSRDLFAETSVRAARPLGGGLSLGAGIWGAAQPGAARLDLGPSATLRLPQLRASLSADWRFRAAGKARPGSGPALTLWTDF